MSKGVAYLCFDVGTQSLRASLIDSNGQLLIKEQIAFDPPDEPQPGWAEYPAELFWRTLTLAGRKVLASSIALAADIAAIGVTCQRASIVCLGDNNEPLCPAILWSDQRRTEHIAPIGGLIGLGMKAIGVANTVKHFQHEAEINWLAQNRPKIWQACDKVVYVSGYLTFKLCGKFVDSSANQVGYLPFDFKKHAWASSRQWHWQALPALSRSQLPALMPVSSHLGQLSDSAALALGTSGGIPIIACATDKACEVIGSGCTQTHQACLSYGTAATVNVTTDRYTEVERFVPSYPAATPQHYLCEVQTHRGFWLVNWFKQQFGSDEVRRADIESVATESLFDELLEATSPGADGLIAQPYWSPGVRVPGPEARGAIIGFNGSHTRAHVYRALMEGLVFSLKDGLRKIEQATKQPVSVIRVAGGGSQSDKVMQITADVFNLTVERNGEFEASSLGAAMCCAVATGHYISIQQAAENMTAVGKTFTPQVSTAKRYNDIYQEVYRPMYRQLQPLYKRIFSLNQQTTIDRKV